MEFTGTGKKLSDTDLPRIGRVIGVGEDEIHAVLDVEAAGRGFDRHNRPKMLFEPHVFYRELPENQRPLAVQKGLAYHKWRRDYPADSYPRLQKAMLINRNAALRSASWGLGQIMGFNCELCGFSSAEAMVEAFKTGEAAQLEAMINFIRNAGLDDELRRHDWRGFARGYNGAGYEKNGYHTKLAAAYAKWSRIKDTPWKPSDTPPPPDYVKPEEALPAPVFGGQAGFWSAIIAAIASAFTGKAKQ